MEMLAEVVEALANGMIANDVGRELIGHDWRVFGHDDWRGFRAVLLDVGCLGCGLSWMWVVLDVGCLGYGLSRDGSRQELQDQGRVK
jgi:hypothetical protein